MNKLIFIFICLTTLVSTSYAKTIPPIVYGKINKEARYVTQKKDFERTAKTTGVKDVANDDTRLGAKGLIEADLFRANYKIEVGLNSNYDRGTGSSNDGSIYIRLARINFETKYGVLIFGQTYTATALAYLKLDPFWQTGASIIGLDQTEILENMNGNLGHYYRGRKDLIGYESPRFKGFFFTITIDKDQNVFNPKTNPTQEYYEANTNYEWKQKNMSGKVMLGFMGGKANSTTYPNYKNETNILLGTSFTYTRMTGTLGIQSFKMKSSVAGVSDQKATRLLGTFKIKIKDENIIALTYANRKNEITSSIEETHAQFAVGYIHNFNKYVSARAITAFLTSEYEGTSTANNKGNMVIIGSTVKF